MNMQGKNNKATHNTRALGEAERWFVRLLDPDCTAAERDAFERWRANNAAHAAAYHQIERIWAMSGDAVSRDPALALAARRALHAPAVRPKHRRWPVFTAAALVVLSLAALFVPNWHASRTAPTGTEYSTIIGQQRTVTLTDGSSVLLDTNSQMMVRYSDSVRRVDLRRGRAQFSVQGNRQWPFVVHAQDGTVTAVGTRFQVSLDGNQVDVTLLEGRLAVATQADAKVRHAALMSRQQLHFDSSTGTIGPVQPADMLLAEGWTTKKLFVHDWRLPALLDEMNRYSSTKVVIGDPSLRQLRISGVFHLGDQKTLLVALEEGWSIHATKTTLGRVFLWRK